MMNKQRILQQARQAAMQSAVHLVEPEGHGAAGDGLLALDMPDGRRELFAAQVKAVDRLQTLRAMSGQAGPSRQLRRLLVAPYLSQAAAAECRRLGLNFIDAAGNAYIDVPGQLVFVTGMPRPEDARVLREHGALRTANGLRIVFALLTQPGLVRQPQRDIAAQAGVALGSVGKVLEDLQRHGHLSLGHGADRRLLAVDELQQAWARHYPVSLRSKLNPRRYRATMDWQWQAASLPSGQAVWGGELAASHLQGYLQPAEATVYSWVARERLMMELRLRPDPAGTIEILDAFWPQRSQEAAAVAPALLVYADLLASPDGRNQDAAARLWESIPHA